MIRELHPGRTAQVVRTRTRTTSPRRPRRKAISGLLVAECNALTTATFHTAQHVAPSSRYFPIREWIDALRSCSPYHHRTSYSNTPFGVSFNGRSHYEQQQGVDGGAAGFTSLLFIGLSSPTSIHPSMVFAAAQAVMDGAVDRFAPFGGLEPFNLRRQTSRGLDSTTTSSASASTAGA